MKTEIGRCHACGRESYVYVQYLGQHLCRKHFERMLIRRVRSTTITEFPGERRFDMVEGGSGPSRLISFVFRRSKTAEHYLDSNVLEDFAIEVFKYFAYDKKPKTRIKSAGTFNPLFSTSENEIARFLELKKIRVGVPKRSKQDAKLLELLREIETRRPGGMLSLVKIGRRIGVI